LSIISFIDSNYVFLRNFGTYSEKFWQERLDWFQEQADKSLIGTIDYKKTGNGTIVCKDGFTATTFTKKELTNLAKETTCPYDIVEVDESSLFLIITKL